MWWAALLNSLLGTLSSGVPPITGSYESIASATPTSGYSVNFTGIASTYASLQLRIHFISSDANFNNITLQFNSDTGSNYARHQLVGSGSAVAAAGTANDTQCVLTSNPNSSPGTTTPRVAIVDIHDYASTTKYKTVRAFSGFDSNSTNSALGLYSSLWMSTSAISSITVGFFQQLAAGTTISLYGIKG